eukprot:jgi/Bigna1/127580/aug1.4_g2288
MAITSIDPALKVRLEAALEKIEARFNVESVGNVDSVEAALERLLNLEIQLQNGSSSNENATGSSPSSHNVILPSPPSQNKKDAEVKEEAKMKTTPKVVKEGKSVNKPAGEKIGTLDLKGLFKKISYKGAAAGSFMVLEPGKKSKMKAIASGVGLTKLKEVMNPERVLFACLNVHGVDDKNVRTKLVQVEYVGEKVSGMKRMAALEGRRTVGKIFSGIAVNFRLVSTDDLSPSEIGIALLHVDSMKFHN